MHWLVGSRSERPTAIVAFNDAMAIGALQAAQARGLRVGSDIAVTGFDDAPMVQYLTPPLTTLRQPIAEVGKRVLSILVHLLRGTPFEPHLLLAPQLIVRQSTLGSSAT